MHDMLTIIMAAAAIALVFNIFLKRFQIPPIIGYILSGAVIARLFHLEAAGNHTLHQVAEFGIVFLMFTIALEFSMAHLMSMKREVLLHGGAQVGLSLLVFAGAAWGLFGLEPKTAIIVGAALALSSTAIVLKIFNERGEISRSYGRQSLGILLFQDIAVIPILLMIAIFTDADRSLGALLLETLLHAAAVLALLYVIGKYVLDKFLALVIDTRSHEIFLGAVLLLVVAASALAHAFGFSYSLGAFIAGIMIAETHYRHQIEADLAPFRDILLGVFFVTVGMQIDLGFMAANILPILGIMAAVMGVKALLIFGVIRTGADKRTAVKTGIALSQVGEFSFAVFELARAGGLLQRDTAQLMVIAVVFSMILTPFILKNLARLSNLFIGKKKPDEEPGPIRSAGAAGHIVVLGYSHLGRTLADQLAAKGIPYLAVEYHRQLVEEGAKRGHAVMFGNAAQRTILESAGVADAAAVIIAIEDERRIRLVSEAVLELSPFANIVVKVSDAGMFHELSDLPIRHLLDEHAEVAKVLVDNALTCEIGKR